MTESAESGNTLILSGWAHRCGIIGLGEAVVPSSMQAISDRLLFSERIARYCWAYDERRVELLADCFAEDAVWEGNVLGETPIGPFKGRNAICKWLSDFWPHQHDQRRHMILNTLIEFQAENAASTLSYLLLMSSDGTKSKPETTGFYHVDYKRCGDVWKIVHLKAGFDAPFWPGNIKTMSERGRARHGVSPDA